MPISKNRVNQLVTSLDNINDDYGLSHKEDREKKVALVIEYLKEQHRTMYELTKIEAIIDYAESLKGKIQFIFKSE